MKNDELTAEQVRDLRALAGTIIPSSATYGVPGADDEKIFNDILRSLNATTPIFVAHWRISPRSWGTVSPISNQRAARRWPPPFVTSAARRLPHSSAWCCFAITVTTG
jgi:hypothetical protein